jgi:hypothetical protein
MHGEIEGQVKGLRKPVVRLHDDQRSGHAQVRFQFAIPDLHAYRLPGAARGEQDVRQIG